MAPSERAPRAASQSKPPDPYIVLFATLIDRKEPSPKDTRFLARGRDVRGASGRETVMGVSSTVRSARVAVALRSRCAPNASLDCIPEQCIRQMNEARFRFSCFCFWWGVSILASVFCRPVLTPPRPRLGYARSGDVLDGSTRGMGRRER